MFQTWEMRKPLLLISHINTDHAIFLSRYHSEILCYCIINFLFYIKLLMIMFTRKYNNVCTTWKIKKRETKNLKACHSSDLKPKTCYILDSPRPVFKVVGREEILITSQEVGTLKDQKKRWKYGAGAGVLESVGGGCWHFSNLIFWRFIIFTFRNYFTFWSCLKMSLKLFHKLQ